VATAYNKTSSTALKIKNIGFLSASVSQTNEVTLMMNVSSILNYQINNETFALSLV
jgi:hypothetical protein